jgi:hypothetical protein
MLETLVEKSSERIDAMKQFWIFHTITADEVEEAGGGVAHFVGKTKFRDQEWSIDLMLDGKRQELCLNSSDGSGKTLRHARVYLDDKQVAHIDTETSMENEVTVLYKFTAAQEKKLKKAGTEISVMVTLE